MLCLITQRTHRSKSGAAMNIGKNIQCCRMRRDVSQQWLADANAKTICPFQFDGSPHSCCGHSC